MAKRKDSYDRQEDLLTNPTVIKNLSRQRNKIDYSTLDVDNLDLGLEIEKAADGCIKKTEKSYKEPFKEEVSAQELIQRTLNRIIRNRIIRITRVDFVFKTNAFENLQDFWGMWIDSPTRGIQTNSSSILVAGWILGKSRSVSMIKVLLDGETVDESLVNLSRPDIAEKYFFVPNACNSGFCISLSADNLPSKAHVIIQADFSDNSSLVIGAIQYCKY